MAAAAAGVSLVALTPPAEAKVVITTHINIAITNTTSIDLNHDGIADLTFTLGGYNHALGAYSTYLNVAGLNGGGVVEKKNTGLASNLLRSAKIGPSANFSSYGLMARRAGCYMCPTSSTGDWGGGQPNRFLGVKFLIHGTTHYGWVRLTVTSSKTKLTTATITEYGYETIANKLVLAGLPSKTAQASSEEDISELRASLGTLALGVDGLAMWRREDSV
jgi:hypothetical protein